jgi:ABC-2 type transport system permease protein
VTPLRLLWLHLRVGALNELEYRAHFWMQLFESLLGLIFALAGLGIVFTHTDRLGDWRQAELIVLLGVYFLVGGAIRTVVQPSIQRFMEDVRQGTLDFALTKPVDAQALISVRYPQVWKLVDVLLGIGLIAIALLELGAEIGLLQALSFVVALIAGGAMVYSLWLMLATMTFWFVRLENILVILVAMWEAGRWPVGIYPPWLRLTLTFVIPVAFATTVPAEALAGRLTNETLLGALALAAGLLALSRWFWSIGVRHYSGASA